MGTAAMTSAPPRTAVQRREALLRANDVRSRRAVLKRDLKAGRVRFGDLLADPPDYLRTAKVYDLLLSVPKVGRTKAGQAFVKARIAPSKTFDGISARQVSELRARLESRL